MKEGNYEEGQDSYRSWLGVINRWQMDYSTAISGKCPLTVLGQWISVALYLQGQRP